MIRGLHHADNGANIDRHTHQYRFLVGIGTSRVAASATKKSPRAPPLTRIGFRIGDDDAPKLSDGFPAFLGA